MFAANEGEGSRYPNDTVTSEFSCVFLYQGTANYRLYSELRYYIMITPFSHKRVFFIFSLNSSSRFKNVPPAVKRAT
jgi:hypothetical protein